MIEYEWAIEEVDSESGDILDLDFSESLDEFYADDLETAIRRGEDPEKPSTHLRLVLVRDNRRRSGELMDREWAYVIEGKLENHFRFFGENSETSHKVPARFTRELRSHVAKS